MLNHSIMAVLFFFFPLPFPLLGKINELYLESFCFLGGNVS